MKEVEFNTGQDLNLFTDPFYMVSNSRVRHNQMTAIMDADPTSVNTRFDDWYNYFHNLTKSTTE